MDGSAAERLLRQLSSAQRDQLLLDVLKRDSRAAAAAAAAAAAVVEAEAAAAADELAGSTAAFADLPWPALELIAGYVYASFSPRVGEAAPVSEVLATARALRGTCRAWRRGIETGSTVSSLFLGPKASGQLWWDPTHGATMRTVHVQPVPPRVYPTAGPAAGMGLPGAITDTARAEMQLECRVVRLGGSGAVRLEVCGSRRLPPDETNHQQPPEPLDGLHPQVELCDRGGGGSTVWVRAGVDLSRGEIPWHSCVPYPWPDVANVNPRPIYALPLPPPESLAVSFASLSHLSLAGLLLGRLPAALQSLPSLAVLELRGNLLRNLPSWLSQMEQLRTIELTDSGLPDSFLASDQAMNGGAGPLPPFLTDLRMGEMQGFDPYHDPYERMTSLPRWLGLGAALEASGGSFCTSLRRLDLSHNQIDMRAVALPWHSRRQQPAAARNTAGAAGSAANAAAEDRRPADSSSGGLPSPQSAPIAALRSGSCPWVSLRYLSLRHLRTNAVPYFLSSLHLTELDLNGLDLHDRGGGAIALAPADAAAGPTPLYPTNTSILLCSVCARPSAARHWLLACLLACSVSI
jgi:hypothetical protein